MSRALEKIRACEVLMTIDKNRQITLAARPQGAPKKSDFRLVETAIPVQLFVMFFYSANFVYSSL